MPIEIKELVIRAVAAGEDRASGRPQRPVLPPEEKDQIIEECVRQIMRILRKEEER